MDADMTLASTAKDFICTRDLEALLVDLRAQQQRRATDSISSLEGTAEAARAGKEPTDSPSLHVHPSLHFYWGQRPAQVQSPVDGARKSLFVIALHQALLPPSENSTAESQSARLSNSEGIELLRANWSLLVCLLFPSIQSVASESERASFANATLEYSLPSTPIVSVDELQTPLTYSEYTQFREAGATDRVHYSYVVFLRFFGWRLHNEESGELDRHGNWRERYEYLSRFHCGHSQTKEICERYGTVCFYAAITRIVRVLLEFCLTRYAVNLVAFLLEEMGKGRLLFLFESLQEHWISQIFCSKQVADSDKNRLRSQLYRLTHSDSD